MKLFSRLFKKKHVKSDESPIIPIGARPPSPPVKPPSVAPVADADGFDLEPVEETEEDDEGKG